MKRIPCKLASPGWSAPTRRALEQLIQRGAGRSLPVVLDFDNTIVCGDIGEATLAVLVRDGRLTAARLPATLSPPFRLPSRGMVTLHSSTDVTEYYERFLAPTAHGDRDPTPLANGYAWAVEVMENLRLSDVVDAARAACACARPPQPGFIEVTPGKTRYPAPVFYPEMTELIAELLRHRFDVWIVSASNVWSVRWMVAHELNPRLRQHGVRSGLPPDHILGLSTLLTDDRGRLFKDALLVKENACYAALDERALRDLRLTSRLQFPVPTYSGKIACILDAIGRRPFLGVGDSPGDHPMLAFSQHRLWIARLEKPGYQKQTTELVRTTGAAGWMVQAVLSKLSPGFVSELDSLAEILGGLPGDVRASATVVSVLEKRLRAARPIHRRTFRSSRTPGVGWSRVK